MRNFKQLSGRENKCTLYSGLVCKMLYTLHVFSSFQYYFKLFTVGV